MDLFNTEFLFPQKFMRRRKKEKKAEYALGSLYSKQRHKTANYHPTMINSKDKPELADSSDLQEAPR